MPNIDISKRLSDIIAYSNGVSSFSQKTGVSRQTVYDLTSGKSKPAYSILNKIAENYPEIDTTWLLTGKGEMLLTNENKAEKINSNLAVEKEWQPQPTTPNTIIVDSLASAEQSKKGIATYLPKLSPRQTPYLMVCISGNSMQPDYYDGDYVVCYELEDPKELLADAVHIVTSNEGTYLKEVRYVNDKSDDPHTGLLRLSSRNQDYKPIYLHHDENEVKLYRVVCVLRSV